MTYFITWHLLWPLEIFDIRLNLIIDLDRTGSKLANDIAYTQELSRHRQVMPLYDLVPEIDNAWIAPNATIGKSYWADFLKLVKSSSANGPQFGTMWPSGESSTLLELDISVPSEITLWSTQLKPFLTDLLLQSTLARMWPLKPTAASTVASSMMMLSSATTQSSCLELSLREGARFCQTL